MFYLSEASGGDAGIWSFRNFPEEEEGVIGPLLAGR